jgi:hypothetical protein
MRFWVWAWTYLLFLIEGGLVALAFGCRGRFRAVRDFFGRLARSRRAPLIAGGVAIALRLAVLPVEPVPVPGVHDEFSYLLAAATFAHGRLVNPTHPMWQHFESMQIEHQPAYASMYRPLQGLVPAAGVVSTGAAFAGVCLSLGIMCGALCWGLAGWFPPGWAFLGAMLAALRLSMFSYWADSYWGGALLFGAVPRLIRRSRPRDAALAALGIAMLDNRRPYVGLAFSVAAGFILLAGVRRLKTAGRAACVFGGSASRGSVDGILQLACFRVSHYAALHRQSPDLRDGGDVPLSSAALRAALSPPELARLLCRMGTRLFPLRAHFQGIPEHFIFKTLRALAVFHRSGPHPAVYCGGVDLAQPPYARISTYGRRDGRRDEPGPVVHGALSRARHGTDIGTRPSRACAHSGAGGPAWRRPSRPSVLPWWRSAWRWPSRPLPSS